MDCAGVCSAADPCVVIIRYEKALDTVGHTTGCDVLIGPAAQVHRDSE